MSNRGVRGVRVVGPGLRPGGKRPADHSTETVAENGLNGGEHDQTAELGPHDAAAQEAAAVEAIQAAGAGAPTQEQPEAATACEVPSETRTTGSRRWPMRVATAIAAFGVAGTIGFGYGYFHLNGQQSDVSAAKKQVQHYIIALTNFDPK